MARSGDTGLIGGIEAGGTKFVLAVGSAPNAIKARHEIPTRDPAATLEEAAQWFEKHGQICGLGIATFGPAQLDPNSPQWGHILQTPKPDWSDCGIAPFFTDRLGVPAGFDTDVNGAALAEYRFGAGKDAGSLAYVTVGTGIGGGLIIDGHPVHGAAHPEMGHMFPRHSADDGGFAGICPAHGDCLEGVASGPAIKARWGGSLSDLSPDHSAHETVAAYLAQLCHTLFAVTAVETVVLGGGVMNTPGLLDRVRAASDGLGNGYLPGIGKHRITGPALGANAGITGALLLAPHG
ncbi:ROK family protein [Pontixanthobacter sp.]|uniref:ROK family protein n=1 Tax=Pontixanthobacter sp. TaxID=2792078 RepID=UPI003C7DC92A